MYLIKKNVRESSIEKNKKIIFFLLILKMVVINDSNNKPNMYFCLFNILYICNVWSTFEHFTWRSLSHSIHLLCYVASLYHCMCACLSNVLCCQDSEMSPLQDLCLVLEKLEKVSIVLKEATAEHPPLSFSESKLFQYNPPPLIRAPWDLGVPVFEKC